MPPWFPMRCKARARNAHPSGRGLHGRTDRIRVRALLPRSPRRHRPLRFPKGRPRSKPFEPTRGRTRGRSRSRRRSQSLGRGRLRRLRPEARRCRHLSKGRTRPPPSVRASGHPPRLPRQACLRMPWRTPPASTENLRSWRATSAASSVRGSSFRLMKRPALVATRATAARLPANPAASMMFWGLGRGSRSAGDVNCGR